MNNTDGAAIYQLISLVLYRKQFVHVGTNIFIFHSCSNSRTKKRSPIIYGPIHTPQASMSTFIYASQLAGRPQTRGRGDIFFLSKVAVQRAAN